MPSATAFWCRGRRGENLSGFFAELFELSGLGLIQGWIEIDPCDSLVVPSTSFLGGTLLVEIGREEKPIRRRAPVIEN